MQLWKRNVSIRDDSGSSVEVTLWGGYAQEPGDAVQEVCAYTVFYADSMPIPANMMVLCASFNPQSYFITSI